MNILHNFITEQEKQSIISFLNYLENTFRRGAEKRWVFGTKYGGNHVSDTIPEIFLPIIERLEYSPLPDSIVITKYTTGEEKRWHTDSLEAGPVISILNVSGEGEIGFRDENKTEKDSILMKEGDLLVLQGEERYKWQHCVKPLSQERVSVVFRKRTPIL